MSLDIEKRIEKIEELVEENNKMLHKIRRREIFYFWFGVLKLLIFVGIFYYGYVLLQPFLNQIWGAYQEFKTTIESANDVKRDLNIGVPKIDVNKFLDKIPSN